MGCPTEQPCDDNTAAGSNPCFSKSVFGPTSLRYLPSLKLEPETNFAFLVIFFCFFFDADRTSNTLTTLLSPLSVAQGNDTTRMHYDLRTLPVNVRLSARDLTTEGAPERYLPRSDVRHLMHKRAFHSSLSVRILSAPYALRLIRRFTVSPDRI